MASNQERLSALYTTLRDLEGQIQDRGLESRVVEEADRVRADPARLHPITSDEWAVMLPGERERHLVAYYLVSRAELLTLEREGRKQRQAGRLSDWLGSPAVQLIGLAAALATVADFVMMHGWEALRALGFGYDDHRSFFGESHEDAWG